MEQILLDRIKIIDKILDGSPSRFRESYFSKNSPSVYSDILRYCVNISDLKFVQKVWHWVNDFPQYYRCRCGKSTSFNRNWKDGYRKYCSAKCAQSDLSTKEKRRQTNIKIYGVDNVAKNVDIQKKIESTNLEKYGSRSSFQNTEVRNKWKKTIELKYGTDHYFKTDQFKEKAKDHYLFRYGVDHQSKVSEVKDKIKNTCLFRYGVSTYLNTDHARGCVKSYNRSSYEDEIFNWIKSLGIDVNHSNRTILSPLLLDIYIPSKKLAIEFNGLYWHSDFYKDKNYHLNKTLECNKVGVSLIHVWEDDWNHRKEIVKSIIMNRLGLISNRMYARSCFIKDVNNRDTSLFLNENHIQGYSRFSKSLGLYFGDELVSLMTFGFRATNGKREYELIRFCNKINTNVIGSASKLFSYFIKNFDGDIISSYADLSIFDGGLYKNLGFEYSHRSQVNYWWVVNGFRRHRFNYSKKKLVKSGHDPLMTENEIMKSLGYFRVWGCGQDKWVWTR